MLDDHHRVALVAELLQGCDEFSVVFLVEAYGRLVQDIEHIDKLGTDLRCETDPLRLASGERGGRPVERKVVKSDIQQEAHPVAEFFQDVPRYDSFPFGKLLLNGVEPCLQVRHLHRRDLGDLLPAYPEKEGLLVEPGPAADGADYSVFYVPDHSVEGHHLREIAVAYAEQLVRAEYQKRNSLVGDGGDGVE